MNGFYCYTGNRRNTAYIENSNQDTKKSANLSECWISGHAPDNDVNCFDYVRNELSRREGFFKLEYSSNLTLSNLFQMYRRHDTVEKLMNSLSGHIDLSPMQI